MTASDLNKIVTTSDGSHTIYVPKLDEHYHSVHGAIQESRFIYIREGFDFCTNKNIQIFEVGFGTGLNALLTALRSEDAGRAVIYTTIEKYPLDDNMISLLNYPGLTDRRGSELFVSIHSAEWGKLTPVTANFSILKIRDDLLTASSGGPYDLIYFDAFGPDKQPEMWTAEVFSRISDATKSGGILVTYSAKGDVKRNLIKSGFKISVLPGPPGKRHIIRAIKS